MKITGDNVVLACLSYYYDTVPEKSSLRKDLLFVDLLNFASRFLGVVHHRKGAMVAGAGLSWLHCICS